MPKILYRAPVKVLLAVRGHRFDRTAFDAIFQSMDGIEVTVVDQPAAALLMNPIGMRRFNALVLYDMPGLDFEAPNRPGYVHPELEFQSGFSALLEEGKGIVALHHSLASWPAWPKYAETLGGAFLYHPHVVRGSVRPDSGYRQHVDYVAEVVAGDHPIVDGIPTTFSLHDELYLAEVFEAEVQPLIRARYAFTRENFYSADAAMQGKMNCREGWEHAEGSNLLAWYKRAGNSPVVYIQPGDTRATYDEPIYRRLIANSIRWVISESGVRL